MAHARDPWVTASMLTALFLLHHLALALTHVVLCLLTREAINPIDRVWDFREAHFRSLSGYRFFLTHVVTAAVSIPLEVLIVGRAKLILDFAMTMQCTTVLFTWLYSGAFPTTRTWWVLWLLASAITVFGGEFACMRLELRPILFFNHNSTNDTTTDTTTDTIETPARDPRRSKELLGRKSQDRRSFQIHENDRLMVDEGDIELQERNRSMDEGRA